MIGGLVGMAAADVAFVESAQAALVALLTGWRLPAGSRVACLPGRVLAEHRPAAHLRAAPGAAAGRRHRPRRRRRRVERLLADDPPSFVHLTHIPQPPRRCSSRRPRSRRCAGRPGCRWCSTPPSRWATPTPTSAPTSSTAPRASGWPARAASACCACARRSPRSSPRSCPEPEGVPPMRAFESGEAHVAGRVGPGRGGRRAPRRGPGPGARAARGDRPGHPRAARRRRTAGG